MTLRPEAVVPWSRPPPGFPDLDLSLLSQIYVRGDHVSSLKPVPAGVFAPSLPPSAADEGCLPHWGCFTGRMLTAYDIFGSSPTVSGETGLWLQASSTSSCLNNQSVYLGHMTCTRQDDFTQCGLSRRPLGCQRHHLDLAFCHPCQWWEAPEVSTQNWVRSLPFTGPSKWWGPPAPTRQESETPSISVSFQTVVLERTLESPLDSKEIKQVNPKGNQPWILTGRA